MSYAGIVLLDHNFQFLQTLTIKKCVKLMVKQKVEVIKETDKLLRTGFFLPKVVRLLKAINTNFNKKMPYSKQSVFIRDTYKCQYCGKELTPKNATVDHVLPSSKGGKSSFLNCVTSCRVCNHWKGDKLLSQTSMQLLKTPTHPTYSEFMYMKMISIGISIKDIWG